MPLNKLENFIKNTDGRTLYVNPADLNATDSITNEGTSLTEPFRTIQRALLESARFSYQRGNDNDLIEKTTIVIYPGEHTIDNRPGYGIRLTDDTPVAVAPSGTEVQDPAAFFNLTSDTNFDIESEDNVLWHFNSIHGGVIVPRGTSIVGMDLRKTKIRPLYVPNPTDPSVPYSAIFRVTGTCYFWQFTIFDGQDGVPVFTSNIDYSDNNRSLPTFSHHKLTAFEYADGINIPDGFQQTDLAMYYSKLSNAYNEASGRDIDEKYPLQDDGFAPKRPEFEIVGAFATDPINISNIISGDGFVADAVVTVTTAVDHNLSSGTPIKIRGVAVPDYNVSTIVSSVISATVFTYTLTFVRTNLPARPSTASANVTVETDTVTGASPYIFNVSMRSVWGINGMHADGSKATGFRSMVVAQFTAISLQKDDRSFVKYNEQARSYDSINVPVVRGAELSALSSSTNTSSVYHLDPRAIYRPGWETTHIKLSNDAVLQIVSVFAIGFNQHFAALTGSDASITNSNSNFGQFALLSGGFKKDAFDKDDQGFITQVVTPRTAYNPENDDIENIDWANIDFATTAKTSTPNNQIYLLGFTNLEARPPAITQGYRIGAKFGEVLFQPLLVGDPVGAEVRMTDKPENSGTQTGEDVAERYYEVVGGPTDSQLTLPPHKLLPGESVRIFSSSGDLPENIQQNTLYYANVIDGETIRLATSEANALNGVILDIYGGSDLSIVSRVNDKKVGEPGHPVQYDFDEGQWFVHVAPNSQLYTYIKNNPESLEGTDTVSYFTRQPDDRNLNDKLYRLRYVIPRTATNAKPPTAGYVLQYSSQTGVRNDDDFTKTSLNQNDYAYNRNPRWLVNAAANTVAGELTFFCDKPHQMSVGENVQILNVVSSNNPDGVNTLGYNGSFDVIRIVDARTFVVSNVDGNGVIRNPGAWQNDINVRNTLLPRYQRKNNKANIFVYRVEEIIEFRQGIRDGVYHLFALNGSNAAPEPFSGRTYNQPIEYLYPQQDRDNVDDNPPSTQTFAKRSPLGDVTIDEPQHSLTRETVDKLVGTLNAGKIVNVTTTNVAYKLTFDREHSYNGVYAPASIVGGSGYTNGTYYAVKLLTNSNWKGATATVVVQSGSVTQVFITDPGSAYTVGETLTIDNSTLGGGNGARITLDANSISNNIDTVIQVTGLGNNSPTFYSYITNIPNTREIEIARRVNVTPRPKEGMLAIAVDSGTRISTSSYDSETGITRFNTSGEISFGLNRGNSFEVFASNRTPLGKFYVSEVINSTAIEAYTGLDIGNVDGGLVGKCGLEDNDAPTGSGGENISVRGSVYFGNSTFYVLSSNSGSSDTFFVGAKEGGEDGYVQEKLPLGTYIQVGNEIMRISSSNFTGTSSNNIKVIRGALGTAVVNHPQGTKIRVIVPQPIELRRPSILRASGHTFEYLGYGPGNYSTALPQLQVEQLPENEVYLVQSQELACGQVVYTGMSDNGDFYIGNIKYSATSGTQVTFDVPVPTIAGEDASSNNVIFDEVTVTRRLFVQGGDTNEVQSQFDGPVKFTQDVTFKKDITVNGTATIFQLNLQSDLNATSPTSNAALKVKGGAAIAKDVYIGGLMSSESIFTEDLTVELLKTNTIDVKDLDEDVTLFASIGEDTVIEVGREGEDSTVSFNSTKDITTNNPDERDTADAAVTIDGGLVVRKRLLAERVIGEGATKIGSIILWGGTEDNIPEGYLLCDGAAYPKQSAIYSELFDVIGTVHGEANNGTRFRVPDLRSKFVAGAAGGYDVAEEGGLNRVELTEDELAAHNHGISIESTSHGHPEANVTVENADAEHDHTASSSSRGSHSHSGSASKQNTGVSIRSAGQHSHGYTYARDSGGNDGGDNNNVDSEDGNTGAAGAHNHSLSDPGHSHTINLNSNGSHTHAVNVDVGLARHDHDATVVIPVLEQEHTHVIDSTGINASHENRPPFYALCYLIQYA